MDIDSALSVADLKARMAELYSSLADVKMALTDAREEIRTKDEEIAAPKNRDAGAKPLIEKDGFQYEMFDGKPTGLPFCPKCLRDGIQIRPVNRLSGFQCPRCKANYHMLRYGS
jgi:hypothetical protein